MPQKGITWVSGKITKPDAISLADFESWYNDIHVPDIIKATGISAAYRYRAIDPSADRPYLALYPASDMEALASKDLAGVRQTSEYFPGSGRHADFADFDIRFYEFIQGFEKEGVAAGMAPLTVLNRFAFDDCENRTSEPHHLRRLHTGGWDG